MFDFGENWHQLVKWTMIAIMVFAVALLASQHLQHVVGILPLLLLLACPLMHLFGHGHHHHSVEPRNEVQSPDSKETVRHGR